MKQYQNILVNALVNLGDVVLTTSAVALLRQAYPGGRRLRCLLSLYAVKP